MNAYEETIPVKPAMSDPAGRIVVKLSIRQQEPPVTFLKVSPYGSADVQVAAHTRPDYRCPRYAMSGVAAWTPDRNTGEGAWVGW